MPGRWASGPLAPRWKRFLKGRLGGWDRRLGRMAMESLVNPFDDVIELDLEQLAIEGLARLGLVRPGSNRGH